MVHKQTIK